MFSRSRPWRSRGPSLGSSRLGSRRRGRRTDPLISASAAPLTGTAAADDGTSVSASPVEATIIDDTAPVVLANLPVARIDESGLRAMARRALDLAQIKPADLSVPPERLSPAVFVQLLSQRPDDSVRHTRTRRSA